MDPSNVFDFWGLIINELIGDLWLSLFVGVAIVALISIKIKLPKEGMILLEIIFLSMMFAKALEALLVVWVFVILFVGAFFYYVYSSAIRRG